MFSPCLFYGWDSLQEKLSEKCRVLCIEAEPAIHALSEKIIVRKKLNAELLPLKECTPAGINRIIQGLTSRDNDGGFSGMFRRVERIDFSGGVFFNAEFYSRIFSAMQNAVAQFWKNRLTLIKLGRLYCKNIFKNIPAAALGLDFTTLEKSVRRPILVLGAGESVNALLQDYEEQNGCGKENSDGLDGKENAPFIICVDAALPALLERGIVPDAVAASEAQLAVQKAYIGAARATRKKRPLLFCDLASLPAVPKSGIFINCFFFSEFEKNKWTRAMKEAGVLPKCLPPLGSVGLTATEIALCLRADGSVPIYVSGLDFSYRAGVTHARGTPQHKARLLQQGRLRPAANYGAAFSEGALPVSTTAQSLAEPESRSRRFAAKNLAGYAALFRSYFGGAQNLFNIDGGGLDLGIKKLSREEAAQCIQRFLLGIQTKAEQDEATSAVNAAYSSGDKARGVGGRKSSPGQENGRTHAAADFLERERNGLKALRDILVNGEKSQFHKKGMPLKEEILFMLDAREYLYLHFPDGEEPRASQDFLNRVRTQTDFFLKYIRN